MELDFDGIGGREKNRCSTGLDTKYFTPGPARRKVITRQYLNRVSEKRARQQTTADGRFPNFDPVHVVVTGQRLAAHLFREGNDDRDSRYSHRRRAWQHDVTEGRDLARSHVPLPYSGQGPIRRPSLEREEAFRDPATCKRVRVAKEVSAVSVVSVVDDADPETAQLYRMGLLYDDEYTRGSGFTLNTIVHDEPTYTLRPAKRPRKSKAVAAARTAARDLSFSQNGLSLHLSFAQLHNDEMIARYLISPSPSEINPADWEHASLQTTPSEALASVHSLTTEYFPYTTQDTQMSNGSCSAANVPDLISDKDCLVDDDNLQTTQTPDFDCDSDTTSLSGSDADLVILPLHMSRQEDERTRQSATPRRSSLDAAAASWIMLDDDS